MSISTDTIYKHMRHGLSEVSPYKGWEFYRPEILEGLRSDEVQLRCLATHLDTREVLGFSISHICTEAEALDMAKEFTGKLTEKIDSL